MSSREGTADSATAAHALAGPGFSGLLQDVLARRADLRFEASGGSMRPFIRSGDVVTVSPANPRFGDVAACLVAPDGRLVLHRVIGRRQGRYLLRGDACGHADGLVSPGSVIGVVSRVERAGGAVRAGLGPERVLVGGLSRVGLLRPAARAVAGLRRWLG